MNRPFDTRHHAHPDIDALHRRIRTLDLAAAAALAVSLWGAGLGEIAWLPFALLAAHLPGRGAARCPWRARLGR